MIMPFLSLFLNLVLRPVLWFQARKCARISRSIRFVFSVFGIISVPLLIFVIRTRYFFSFLLTWWILIAFLLRILVFDVPLTRLWLLTRKPMCLIMLFSERLHHLGFSSADCRVILSQTSVSITFFHLWNPLTLSGVFYSFIHTLLQKPRIIFEIYIRFLNLKFRFPMARIFVPLLCDHSLWILFTTIFCLSLAGLFYFRDSIKARNLG